ncbi:MAG: TonB-dependent receptor, partial [Pyrinomonadaceae bacterium]|nr:TonB-dependent receptor [Pyrinomonadaceae bacterium]
KFFYFGGYQYTNAETGFVPTARSFTVLPQAFTLLTGERTAANVAAAFNQFNGCTVGVNCLTAADISPIVLRILNTRNPVTGGFIIPTPNANARLIGVDRAGARGFQFGTVATGGVATRTLQENNPLVQQLNVEPSTFKQNQFTLRLDGNLTQKDTISGTFFWAKFPGIDSFPDPSSLASPFSLKRDDQNRTLATSYTRSITPTLINETRFGYFFLNNTRSLDDPFLAITSESVGIINPALNFDNSPGVARLGHFIGRPGTNMAQFSFGGPNDSFNKRKSQNFSISNNTTWVRGKHTIKFGGDFKRSSYDTNLPEEQATEFEKYDSFTQFITGNATEADTQFGLTEKQFRMKDFGFYFTDDFKIGKKLTLNVGARYELFMFPTEKNGRIGNFDFSSFEPCNTRTGGNLALCDNPLPGFIVPNNAQNTGLANVDSAIAVTRKVESKSTIAKEDLNNFAPRIGLAYAVSDKIVLRGGYGLFYDKPSAAFINTVFSNYPFLREVEITVPNGNIPIGNAFNTNSTTLGLNNWLPFRIVRGSGATGGYVIRDNTGVGVDPRGVSTGSALGNIAETFEFRAVDRNLKTPLIQQWNVGGQWEFAKNFVFEARYVGTKGSNLLQSVAFNQGYDLNDTNTPDHIFERFNQAYIAAGSPNGALNAGSTARERGLGRAFGFLNTVTGLVDYNLSAANGTIINFEARVPILGFNVPEALLLKSTAKSIYHGGQFSLTRRFANGLQFNASYTFSKSIDNNSSDPGSTAGGGKPDVPNAGFVVQGDQRNLDANRAVSDFDRTHRFSTNFVYDLPFKSNNALLKGWQISGFFQTQTGTPYTIFAPEPEVSNVSQLTNIVRGSGGLFRFGFGRPNLCGTTLNATGSDITEQAFTAAGNICSPLGGVGSLGRNTLRSPLQARLDFGIVKRTKITERTSFEIGWDVFNVFNRANFGTPDSELGSPDFGKITNTVGGPRVMQFRAKFSF